MTPASQRLRCKQAVGDGNVFLRFSSIFLGVFWIEPTARNCLRELCCAPVSAMFSGDLDVDVGSRLRWCRRFVSRGVDETLRLGGGSGRRVKMTTRTLLVKMMFD
jgi:hypothetical protein